MTTEPAHYDPPDHERVFYRHITTGDLGFVVRRDGKDCIKLDRPSHEICRPFQPAEWVPEKEYRPLTRMQLVQIAFEADKKLCWFLGKHNLARRDWLNLRDEERIAWAENGPGAGGGRRELFAAVMACLEQHAGR